MANLHLQSAVQAVKALKVLKEWLFEHLGVALVHKQKDVELEDSDQLSQSKNRFEYALILAPEKIDLSQRYCLINTLNFRKK